MTDQPILYSYNRDTNVSRITLNRPERMNAFTQAMHSAMREAMANVVADGARALVITGAGRGFCAGQDLNDRAVAAGAAPVDLGQSMEHNYAPLVRSIRTLPIPVIAAVNGVAAGAGCNLALSCDLVMATESASFLQPFCKLGLIPDTGGSYFLPRLVGTQRAMGLALLGDRITARRAVEIGLIWECVDDALFAAHIESTAQNLAAGPTLGFAKTKLALYASATNSLDEQLALETKLMRECGNSDDYREGVAAFKEKRLPKFLGR
ncbi:MAG: 2-(1,2-epoxy-1,2-dihydrophenyl)acetyl-CoA isomerase [Burkholderiales bacterium]|nr:MAG: 2-(1,2-epoxy-1,2-dihydrophenyl)acetyl-CoA isomerase [Betaproteobacteria bacterium]TAG24498.1 MAG: 2-(1,2-epoxy-1,2-dihydrophenyl)acetyl-CoA isomerase [Burkholderiales bacterium]